jgi:membrane protein DedA with SNARE-associated domain
MEELLREWGYIILFGYSFGGGFLALAVAGVFSFSGELNIYISIAVASSANFIGDQFLFLLARNNKAYAKDMMKKYQRKVAYSHLLMKKYGALVIFIQKYIYGVKTLIPLAMGITKYNQTKFMFFNFIASIVWGVVVGSLAYMMGEQILSIGEEYKTYGIFVALAIILGLTYIFKKI